MSAPHRVYFGQIWIDLDKRMKRREVTVVEIAGEKAVCRIANSGKTTQIALARLAKGLGWLPKEPPCELPQHPSAEAILQELIALRRMKERLQHAVVEHPRLTGHETRELYQAFGKRTQIAWAAAENLVAGCPSKSRLITGSTV